MDKTSQTNKTSDINHHKKMSFPSSPQAEKHYLPMHFAYDLLTVLALMNIFYRNMTPVFSISLKSDSP